MKASPKQMSGLTEVVANDLLMLEDFLHDHFESVRGDVPTGVTNLIESCEYSLFTGGKRFRPQLCFAGARAVGCDPQKITPFAAAVELIHTYSLIHDDLPCMDDDDTRRNKPTNHKVYGEATALLAGDALLTEAFAIVARYYKSDPDIALQLTTLLSKAAGLTGMIAGQQLDMNLEASSDISAALEPAQQAAVTELLMQMHTLKTGALIHLCLAGVAVIGKATTDQGQALREYGRAIGLAFQLADDILDYNPQAPEASGLPKYMGREATHNLLRDTTARALKALCLFGVQADGLRALLEANLKRKA